MIRATTVSVFVALFLVSGLAPRPAHATYSRARGHFERIKTLTEEINDHQARRRNDKQEDRLRNEPRYYRSVSELRDACKSASDELSGFGDSIGSGASGEHADRLREPSKLAKNLQYLLERELMAKCEELRVLINSDPSRRDSSFESNLDTVATAVIVPARARFNDFVELTKKCEETQRWLRDSLKTALAMRDDAIRPGTELNKGKQQLESELARSSQDLRRAYETVRDLEARHADAASRCRDAVAAHDAARMASPGSSYLANAASAYQRWVAAENVQKDAARALYDGYLQLERVVADGKSRLVELARVMRDVERYGDQANPEKVVRRYNDFELWTRVFDYEMSR